MSQKVKQTKHTVQNNGLEPIKRFMQVLFSIVQILLVFRFAFKLLGANASNVFVNLIYATTAPLVGLFEGIFSEVNLENNSLAVFEPATVIAIIVIAAVSYIVLRLLSVKPDKKVEHVEVHEQMNAVPLGQVSEAHVRQTSETPLPRASERPMPYESERPMTHETERPMTHASETTMEQRDKNRLEKETQELEEKIRHQQQILEDQRKLDGAAYDEESQILEERNLHQKQILEDQQKMDRALFDEDQFDEDQNDINHEIPVYEKRHRQS